jgi:NAD(P)H dehydrogenase (quinone)
MVAEKLLETVPASQLTLISRSPSKLQDWADRGVNVLAGDPADKDSLVKAYAGGKSLFLISGTNVGSRVPEHQNAIEAAKAAGIQHITYTSVAGSHRLNPTPSAMEHVQTEIDLFESKMSFAALRNQMYTELVHQMIFQESRKDGKLRQIGEHSRVSPVTRQDIANCAAAIMMAPEKHDRVVYEITGPDLMTYAELTQLLNSVTGDTIEYVPSTPEDMYARYDARGWPRESLAHLPQPACFGGDELVQQFVANEAGFSEILSAHVRMITGQQPTSVETCFKHIHNAAG